MAIPKKRTKKDELWDLRREVDRLFREFIEGPEKKRNMVYLPALDIYEDEDKIVIEADIPGVKKEDIKISVEDNILTIKAEKKKEEKAEEKDVVYEEIAYGLYAREIDLPHTVDTEKIEAEYKDGVLKISLPKKEEVKPKQIEIK